MKKIYPLLLAGCLICNFSYGQQNTSGNRTTSGPGGSRWYNYVDDILANETSAPCIPVAGVSNIHRGIWQDTSSIWGNIGSTIYSGNDFTSVGLGLDPFFPGWDALGLLIIGPFDAYIIDSVKVRGWYNRSYATPHKIGVVDTLILTFVQGNGTSTSNMPPNYLTTPALLSDYCAVGQVNFLEMLHDSLNNRAGNLSGTTVVPVPSTSVYKFLLTSTDTNSADDTRGTQYPRSGHVPADPVISYSVTAGNYVSMSVSFKSGDNLYPTFPARDTIQYSDGTAITGYKYGDWSANVAFSATTTGGTVAMFPPYSWLSSDHTSGYFKKEGEPAWGGAYIPNWYFLDGGPSKLQYPHINYHVYCPTCYIYVPASVSNTGLQAETSIYPNPANDELKINYAQSQPANLSITLTNMLGQVMYKQQASVASKEEVIVNTSSLPEGIYIYTIEANGKRTTGRVTVVH